jgi:hypothetical protein
MPASIWALGEWELELVGLRLACILAWPVRPLYHF